MRGPRRRAARTPRAGRRAPGEQGSRGWSRAPVYRRSAPGPLRGGAGRTRQGALRAISPPASSDGSLTGGVARRCPRAALAHVSGDRALRLEAAARVVEQLFNGIGPGRRLRGNGDAGGGIDHAAAMADDEGRGTLAHHDLGIVLDALERVDDEVLGGVRTDQRVADEERRRPAGGDSLRLEADLVDAQEVALRRVVPGGAHRRVAAGMDPVLAVADQEADDSAGQGAGGGPLPGPATGSRSHRRARRRSQQGPEHGAAPRPVVLGDPALEGMGPATRGSLGTSARSGRGTARRQQVADQQQGQRALHRNLLSRGGSSAGGLVSTLFVAGCQWVAEKASASLLPASDPRRCASAATSSGAPASAPSRLASWMASGNLPSAISARISSRRRRQAASASSRSLSRAWRSASSAAFALPRWISARTSPSRAPRSGAAAEPASGAGLSGARSGTPEAAFLLFLSSRDLSRAAGSCGAGGGTEGTATVAPGRLSTRMRNGRGSGGRFGGEETGTGLRTAPPRFQIPEKAAPRTVKARLSSKAAWSNGWRVGSGRVGSGRAGSRSPIARTD